MRRFPPPLSPPLDVQPSSLPHSSRVGEPPPPSRPPGTYVANRVSDKLTEVHDRIYCCRSGSAADTQAVSDYVRFYLDQHAMQVDRLPRVSTASTLFQSITYPNKDKLSASIIVAGWDPIDGGSVYCLPLGGSMHRQKFAIGGSGSTCVLVLFVSTPVPRALAPLDSAISPPPAPPPAQLRLRPRRRAVQAEHGEGGVHSLCEESSRPRDGA